MTRVPRGHSSCSRGCANKLLIIIKRFLFTASKNINHSPSYEQSKNRTYKSLNYHNTLPHVLHTRGLLNRQLQHVHVRVTMCPLTTISLITIHIIHYTYHRYYAYNCVDTICTWAPLISITTIPLHAPRNPELYI